MDRTHRFARTVAIGVAGWGVIAVTGCQQLVLKLWAVWLGSLVAW
jgi:hypothetical protein